MSVASEPITAPQLRSAGLKLARFGQSLIPIGIVQVAVLYIVLAMKPTVGRPDPDFWWHLRLGEDILDSGIPRSDTYSWTMRGEPFVAHEWLSEALIAAIQRTMGYWGNIVVFDAVAIGALAIMYALSLRLGVASRTASLLSLVAVGAMLPFVTVRPQAFTWLLFAAFVWLLSQRPDRRNLILMPALMALWANLHLGFLYGLVAVGLFVVASAVDRLRGRPADLQYAGLLLGLCTVASFANPHGPAILVYPLTYADDREALSMISEWKSPLTLSLTLFPYFLVSLGLIATLLRTWNRSSFHAALVIVFMLFSFGAARNVPFVALLLVPVVGASLIPKVASPHKATMMRARTALPLLAAVAVVTLLVAVSMSDGGFSRIGGPDESDYPHGGAAYAQENLQDARMYNHYTWGGYLLHAAPDVPVFIDGRSDFYGGDFIEDWATIARLEPGWQELIDSYGIDAVFVNRGSKLARELRQNSAWEEVFTGDTEAIFVLR